MGISLYPPRLKDVCANRDYPIYANIFTTCQEDIWDLILENQGKEMTGLPVDGAPTPFEFFLANCYQSEEYMKKAQEAFRFFTREEVRIIPETKVILFATDIERITDPKDLRMIDDNDKFFKFQNAIRDLLGEEQKSPPPEHEHPKIALMKAKARYRDRVKKKKGVEGGLSLTTMMVALCCMGIGLNPLNIGEITYQAASAIFAMRQDKEKYETDIRIMTAGFGSKKKITPKYWIKNPE